MVKVPQEEFYILKEKVKFLEYYWSEYRRQYHDYRKFKDSSTIKRFIKNNKYEEITNVKYNRLSKTYSLSKAQFDSLQKYARISRKLEVILTNDNLPD